MKDLFENVILYFLKETRLYKKRDRVIPKNINLGTIPKT